MTTKSSYSCGAQYIVGQTHTISFVIIALARVFGYTKIDIGVCGVDFDTV
jgi:hypothetical protein